MARRRFGWPLLLLGLVALAWSNSWHAPFELDDGPSIVENHTLRDWSSFAWLNPPAARGETVGGRPVLNATLALNYAIGGLAPIGYHIGNVLIHLAAALTLFGVVRRCAQVAHKPISDAAAFAIAAIWALHPLQTEAVTYVIQRSESLMALFYLLTLYGWTRAMCVEAGHEPEPTAARVNAGRVWRAMSVVACAFGMATKENMVSAPLAVLLFDRALAAGGVREAWSRRRGFYLALAGTWLVLIVDLVSTGGNRGGTVGLGVTTGIGEYVLTQFPAAARYLALCFWPHPLVFEYGPFWVTSVTQVLIPILVVGALGVAAVYAVVRRPVVGAIVFVAVAVLAPTSLVPGTLQMIVEHRMYLPLAAIVVLGVLGIRHAIGTPRTRTLSCIAAATIGALGVLTVARNRVYASELTLWQDTVAKRPDNARAQNNLGVALRRIGRVDDAVVCFRRAIAVQPNHAFAHGNLGDILLLRRDWAAAAAEFRAAAACDPGVADFHINLAAALARLHQNAPAIDQYRAALQIEPGAVDAEVGLAQLLQAEQRTEEAKMLVESALRATPGVAELHVEYGRILEQENAIAAAESEFRAAVRLSPTLAGGWLALGNLKANAGDASEAESAYRAAIRSNPGLAESHFALGNLLARTDRLERAREEFRAALTIQPDYLEALNNLANCELALGQYAAAVEHYRHVRDRRPDDHAVAENLAIAEQMLQAK